MNGVACASLCADGALCCRAASLMIPTEVYHIHSILYITGQYRCYKVEPQIVHVCVATRHADSGSIGARVPCHNGDGHLGAAKHARCLNVNCAVLAAFQLPYYCLLSGCGCGYGSKRMNQLQAVDSTSPWCLSSICAATDRVLPPQPPMQLSRRSASGRMSLQGDRMLMARSRCATPVAASAYISRCALANVMYIQCTIQLGSAGTSVAGASAAGQLLATVQSASGSTPGRPPATAQAA